MQPLDTQIEVALTPICPPWSLGLQSAWRQPCWSRQQRKPPRSAPAERPNTARSSIQPGSGAGWPRQPTARAEPRATGRHETTPSGDTSNSTGYFQDGTLGEARQNVATQRQTRQGDAWHGVASRSQCHDRQGGQLPKRHKRG
jgi:hypothetical protein